MDFEDHHDDAGECLSDPCPYCRRHEDDEDETDDANENGCQECGAREDTECALECPNRLSEQLGELAAGELADQNEETENGCQAEASDDQVGEPGLR